MKIETKKNACYNLREMKIEKKRMVHKNMRIRMRPLMSKMMLEMRKMRNIYEKDEKAKENEDVVVIEALCTVQPLFWQPSLISLV